MKEIDKIEEKLIDGGYRYFVSEIIDKIKRDNNIFQYNIAEHLNLTSLDISNIKTYSRVKKNDELIWKIIQEYNVDYTAIIEQINKNITWRNENEKRKIKENQFQRFAYLYDEIEDLIYVSKLNLNTYKGDSSLENTKNGEIYFGRLFNRSINFHNRDENRNRRIDASELQIMLNGKGIRKLIKDNYIISGIATETDNSDEGFGVKTVLIIPTDLDKDYENFIKYFFRNKELQAKFKASSLKKFKELILNHKKHNKEITIKLPKELITGYNQFLEYFSDYVKYSKGEEIIFNVSKLEDGLAIDLSVSEDSNIDDIGKHLEEYLSFAKDNIDNLKVNIETDINETDFNLLVLDLKHQVTSLKHSLEIANMRNNLLGGQVDHLKELSTNFSKKDNVIHTQIINGGDQQFADKIINKKENNLNELDRKFVQLIYDNTDSEEEREELLESLSSIKDETSSETKKKESKSILSKFIEVIPGEAGKQIVKELVENGAEYFQSLI